MALAIARPKVADFPCPQAVSKATMLATRKGLVQIESRKLVTALHCAYVFSLSLWQGKQLFFMPMQNADSVRGISPDASCTTFQLKGQSGSIHGIDLLGLPTLAPISDNP